MGGDHGPSVVLPACRTFLDTHPTAELVLVGSAEALATTADWPRCQRVVTTEVVAMDDPVETALRRKKDSSMRVAISQLKADDSGNTAAEVCVSAGDRKSVV